MSEIRIGTRSIGPGRPVYFIAEAGSNHDGNLDQARRLIDVAADAGADAVKFQTFRAEALYTRSAGTTDYLKVRKPIFELIRELEMPLEWIPLLAAHCHARGVDFLSTPFDERSADALEPYVSAFKIASYEMTHHGLVQHCARKGKPLIASTGTARLDEVRDMVRAVRAVGCQELVVLQCTARYPAPLETLNLRTLQTMSRELDVLTGLSDHSREPLPGPMAAVALGAVVIEKHFTLSNTLPGPDHGSALEPHELKAVISSVREVERALGSGVKEPPPEEEELRRFARRSVFALRPIAAGERFTTANTAVLRCGKQPAGMHPRELVRVLGRQALRAVAEGVAVQPDEVGPAVLTDGEVAIRPMAAADADRIVAWRARPDVQSQLFSSQSPSRREHDAWFAELQARTDRLELVILWKDLPVGTVSLAGIDLGARSAELGIMLGEPTARSQGVAARACRLLIDLAFEAFGMERVALEMFADNAAARRLYDRLGFVASSRQPKPREKEGRLRPVLAMELPRGSWGERRSRA